MVCNDIPRDIPERDPPRTYARTYVLCENRSSIQSLTLMRSAIILSMQWYGFWPASLSNILYSHNNIINVNNAQLNSWNSN